MMTAIAISLVGGIVVVWWSVLWIVMIALQRRDRERDRLSRIAANHPVQRVIDDPKSSMADIVQAAERCAEQEHYRDHPDELPSDWVHRGPSGMPEPKPPLPKPPANQASTRQNDFSWPAIDENGMEEPADIDLSVTVDIRDDCGPRPPVKADPAKMVEIRHSGKPRRSAAGLSPGGCHRAMHMAGGNWEIARAMFCPHTDDQIIHRSNQ